MGVPEIPSPPHLYSEAIQLKLYQSFIFSIPVLFSIVLLLLFYLFYLKRRASNISSPSLQTLQWRSNQPTSSNPSSLDQVQLKEELKHKIPIITFDEDLRAKNSQCCVCLGEFEMEEELHQIPSCKHLFHIECIHHWLQANSTCPLCRCCIFPSCRSLDVPELHLTSEMDE